MDFDFDFSGWATKNDLLCSDGRTIRRDAFAVNDGDVVPLVWNHQHNSPDNVLGHAMLENCRDGVYAYCTFNDNESGQIAKQLVSNGDVNSLSICANNLKHQGADVVGGTIREVSLVLAGANPGAHIDAVMCHGDDMSEAIIYTGDEITMDRSLFHSDEEDGVLVSDIFEGMSEDQKDAVYNLVENGEVDEEVFDTMSDDELAAVDAIVEAVAEEDAAAADYYDDYDDEDYDEEDEEDYEEFDPEDFEDVDDDDEEYYDDDDYVDEEDAVMTHNAFETGAYEPDIITHADMQEVIDDARRFGSLKESAIQHGLEDTTMLMHADPIYGMDGTEMLFPDNKNLTNTPGFIKRRTEWVDSLMRRVGHTPFSRTKSLLANITMDEARAKGYIKGTEKKSEQFALLKRVTNPTTIYKKQKLDRDDILDITDFDVVNWIKAEMRLMLEEEIARAILIGDGRAAGTDGKIDEDCLRPIWKEVTNTATYANGTSITPWADLAYVASDATDTDAIKAKEFIRTCIKARKNYRGSGNPILFTTEDMLTDMLLLEDLNGRIIYDTMDKLCTALRVSGIVTVPVMENLTAQREIDGDNYTTSLMGILLNPADYTVGCDKGGSVSLFDDFDIDFNQQKYLMETRISGALTIPHSAIIVENYTKA